MATVDEFPLGAVVTRERLDADLFGVTDELRLREPVSWVPDLNGWLVTRRDLAVQILEDAERFTVDDPRFAVRQVMGPNMLGLDGAEQLRHRSPFEPQFKMSAVRRDLVTAVEEHSTRLVAEIAPLGQAEVRTKLAAPLAVRVVAEVLGLDVEPRQLLGWYDDIVTAMTAVSDGEVDSNARPAAMERIGAAVTAASAGDSTLLTRAAADLGVDEVVANAAVVMFGGIETSETMTGSAFAHILDHPKTEEIVSNPDLLVKAIDESLRLEPAVAQIDRFATVDVVLAGVEIAVGDFVMISVAASNRDPDFYAEPATFDPSRPQARNHLAFAKGPHICLGMHLARVETRAAIEAAFSTLKNLRLDGSVAWSGSVFRKPAVVSVSWDADV